MRCADCNTDVDVRLVPVYDIIGQEGAVMHYHLCVGCLREKGLWCDRHGLKTMFYMADEVPEPGAPIEVHDVCVRCCWDSISAMSAETKRESARTIREALGQDGFQALLMFAPPGEESAGSDEHLLYAHAVLCKIHRCTFSEGLADLIMDESGCSSVQ